MPNATWKIPPKEISPKSKDWLIKTLAKNRGLITPEKLKDFLNPQFSQITATKLSQLPQGLKRVKQALDKNEKIIVYSDYDADGICASAILWETLNDLGANVLPYVPHRIKEGYGLSIDAIKSLKAQGANLIITVDHGVTATKQIEESNKLGLDIIVTDHHVLPAILPKPDALVHTTALCGAGVAWRFAWEIVCKLRPSYKDALEEKLELAAIATIADLVPLIGTNRAIVALGLRKLAKTKRVGIKSLLRHSKIEGPIGTYEIGHILAPRINAMGRIEHGLDSLRLLCTKSAQKAEQLAGLLGKTNSKRQDLTTSAIAKAIDMVSREHLIGIVAHDAWHEGVIGLVASRLVEAHHKPMIVIARGQTRSKGSARSIAGFNIIEAIRASSEFLLDAGGHPMAAGFTIETRHIDAFNKKINTYAQVNLSQDLLTPIINIECILPKEEINNQTLATIKLFEPYGIANPQPIFLTKNMRLEDVRGVGQDSKHLKLQVDGFEAIGFNIGNRKADLRPGYKVDLVYILEENRYHGNTNLQLKIRDLKLPKP